MNYWDRFYGIRKNFTNEQWEQISADLRNLVDLKVEKALNQNIKDEVRDQFGECMQRFQQRLWDLGQIEEKQKQIVKDHEFLQKQLNWVLDHCTGKCLGKKDK